MPTSPSPRGFSANMNRSKLAGHAAMFGANAMWGLMSPVAKFAMTSAAVSPFAITQLRVFGAAALFWGASFFQKREHVSGRDMFRLFCASMFAILLNQGCFIFGVGLASPVDASIITTSMPLIALALSAIFLKEAVSGKKVLGIAFGALGAMMLVAGSGSADANGNVGDGCIWGDVLVLFAQFSYAIYIVRYKDLVGKYSPITVMKWMFTFSFLFTAPFSYGQIASADWNIGADVALSLAFIVVGGTFASYILLAMGQKRLRPTIAGMYNYIQPLVASIVAVCWGMDSFGISKAIAAALIFSGVYMVSTGASRKSSAS